ncbi:MAG: phospholipase D-like domain-containing protein [Methanoregula sp.]|jgi:hypothetical protein
MGDLLYNEKDGLAVSGYAGDRTVLLAFDLPEKKTKDLAGFSIGVSKPGKEPDPKHRYFLENRLSFDKTVTKKTAYDAAIWTPSDKAPFQAFHWAHYPALGFGRYTYTVFANYFDGDSIRPGPSVDLAVNLAPPAKGIVNIGFARTMVSSQAYVKKFKNAPLYPSPQSIEPYPAEYTPRHIWLGAHARELVMGFLNNCIHDPGATLDAFTFDLDESAVIDAFCRLGPRARVYQDNSKSHCRVSTDVAGMQHKDAPKKELAHETEAVRAMKAEHVAVKTGHFTSLSHNKVFIRRRDGVAESVLTGSANFTIRGLYVQANSVMVFDDPRVAGLYAQAFDQAWAGSTAEFKKSEIAKDWHEINIGDSRYLFSFAPHGTAYPLKAISDAINGSKRSVLFAMMQVATSTGVAVDAIKKLPEREDLYSMGVIQNEGEINSFKPDVGGKNFTTTSPSYLAKNTPPPFDTEISGGKGKVIHHKLVVCDFNGDNPVVFCGSSNLAAGGETGNSDNLMAIYDRNVAVMFAVETIRQYQHFRFRSKQEKATEKKPLKLDTTDAWTLPFYETGNIYERERQALMYEKKKK